MQSSGTKVVSVSAVILLACLLISVTSIAAQELQPVPEFHCATTGSAPNGDISALIPPHSASSIAEIDVAFHILRGDNGEYDVSAGQCSLQVAILNEAFAGSGISFTLSSIDRTDNSIWSQGSDEAGFKSQLAIDPATTFNVYTGNLSGGILGWTHFPWSYDESDFMHGTVLLYSSMPGGAAVPFAEGDRLVHQAGHYLGLYHTYSTDCATDGDEVEDTPTHLINFFGCPDSLDTCPESPGLDPVQNYMSMSDDDCLDNFTAGQFERMNEIIALYKPSLLFPQLPLTVELALADSVGDASVTYSMMFTNTSEDPQNADIWLTVTGPAGYNDLAFVRNRNFGGLSSTSKNKSYLIASSQTGLYTFTLNVGEYPSTVDDSESANYFRTAPSEKSGLTNAVARVNMQPDTEIRGSDGSLKSVVRCATADPAADNHVEIQNAFERWQAGADLRQSAATTVIPVAFHIIRMDDGSADVTDIQIQSQLNVLNESYASTNFQFTLHSIQRIDNSHWSQNCIQFNVEAEMKQALAVDPATTFNFYIANLGQGWLGWSYLPFQSAEDSWWHGVVVLYSTLPGGTAVPYNEGDTGTHETGHYLGLCHTFVNGCSEPGDHIDDTPFEANPAYGCEIGRDTCPQEGLDPVENFMDYSDDACMDHFTQGQSDFMDAMVATYKPTLTQTTSGPAISGLFTLDTDVGGATVDYSMSFFNNTSANQNVDVWCRVTGPAGYRDLLFTRNINIAASTLAAKDKTYEITATQPGNYEFVLYNGIYPSAPVFTDTASYDFQPAVISADGAMDELEIRSYRLHQNYPNPFNPTTVISYQLPISSFINLSIYDVNGQLARELLSGFVAEGLHEVIWDGTDDSGRPLGSGVYFYQMTTENYVESKKMLLVR